MPLQAIAIILSLVLHGLVGNALWQRFQHERSHLFDLGEGQDIILEPQGLDLSEVTNIGDDLQSIETQAAVAIDQRTPPPPALAALDQPEEMMDDVSQRAIRDVFAIDPQEPPPQDSARTAPEPVRDVIGSEESTVEQELVDAREALPDLIDDHDLIAESQSTLDNINEPNAALRSDAPPQDSLSPTPALRAEEPMPPEEIAQAAPFERARPQPAPPDGIEEPAPESSNEPPAPVLPMDEHQPDVVEVLAQPDQVVIVTEHSSGEEKKGGDATVVGRYLGKINEQVQRSKVNPRSRKTGTVVVKFTIGADGALLSKDVMSSSGVDVLDRAAIATLERASPFPPIPADVSEGPMTFTQSFRFVVR